MGILGSIKRYVKRSLSDKIDSLLVWRLRHSEIKKFNDSRRAAIFSKDNLTSEQQQQTKHDALDMLTHAGEVFVKPTVDTCSGLGCEIVNADSTDEAREIFARLGQDMPGYPANRSMRKVSRQCSHGKAVLMEGNIRHGSIWLIEMAHGRGVFGDDTAEILQWTRKMKSLKLSERHRERSSNID